MFCFKTGDIIPGQGIGIIKLGMGPEQIQELLGAVKIDDRYNTSRLIAENVKIWVDKEKNQTTQIMVHSAFEGKYAGVIGIGSTLADVKNMLHMTWHEELDVYILDQDPGMCFELGDSGDEDDDDENELYEWDELRAPINSISVFRD